MQIPTVITDMKDKHQRSLYSAPCDKHQRSLSSAQDHKHQRSLSSAQDDKHQRSLSRAPDTYICTLLALNLSMQTH